MKNSNFKSIVFSGGGARCFWHLGFMEIVEPELNLKPDRVSCVSAGAAVASLHYSGQTKKGMEFFKKITSENEKNFYPENIFSKTRAFPQYDMYRKAFLEIIDSDALNNLHNGPEIRIMIATPPKWLGPRMATLVGFAGYTVEKKISNPVHPNFGGKVGFRSIMVKATECSTPEELVETVLQSSCTPPFVPILKRDGRTTLDGGLVDNVPVHAVEEDGGSILVLLSRKYPEDKIPKNKNRVYVQPSVPIEITKWDYSNPQGLQDAYALGKRDGESFINNLNKV